MWQEARKQERKIRGMLVDYRKRAERRQCFYDKIKGDPTQFLQLHGRKCRVHLDQSVAISAQKIMMPWNNQKDCLIDRFDVRATLEIIPPVQKQETEPELTSEERQLNYERYRILAQNEFLGIHEEKFLHQLYLEEQFGVNAQYEIEKSSKKKGSQAGAAIGYTYEENENATPFSQTISTIEATRFDDDFNKDDSDSDVDMDVSIDITKIQTSQAHELNSCGRHFGMVSNDFYSFLTKDYDEAETLKIAREEEAEKVLLVGRKSRRERRAQREKKYLGRPPLSPPSYAAKEEKPVKENFDNASDLSRSPSPENSGKITYITSFGGEDELQAHSKISITLNKTNKGAGSSAETYQSSQMSYAEKVKENLQKLKKINQIERIKDVKVRSRSRSRGRDRRRRSRSRSRSHTYRRKRYSSSTSPRRLSRSRLRKKSTSSSSSSSSPSPPPKRTKSKSPSSSSSSSSTTSASQSPEKMEVDEQSLSPGKSTEIKNVPEPSQLTIVKRYYGRKRDGDSSSEVSFDEDNGNEKFASNESSMNEASSSTVATNKKVELRFGNTAATSKASHSTSTATTSSTSNLREKLKKKMKILLNKQYKADKKAEIERLERQIQQQQDREEEMRELALKLRKRQREMRHKYGSPGSNENESGSGESDSENVQSKRNSRSRSKSPSRSKQRTNRRSRSHNSRSRSRSHGSHSYSRMRRRRSRSTSRTRYQRRSRSQSRSRSRSRRSYDRDRYRNYPRRKSRSYSRDSHYSRSNSNYQNSRRSRSPIRSSRRLVDY